MSARAYRVLAFSAGRAASFFYRCTHLGESVPERGPIVLVANHPNGLVDAAVIFAATARPVRFLAKAPLFETPVIGSIARALQTIPVYRAQDQADTQGNAASLAAASAALAEGAAICIFPEGKSHSEPTLARLKTGAARLALAAEAAAGFELGVRIVPVGLVYREKPVFRSRMAIWVGEPLPLEGLAALHAEDAWRAVEALTAEIERALRRVTLNLERWEDLPLLELAEHIWKPRQGRRVPRLRALAEGLRELRARDPARANELAREGQALKDALGRVGLAAGRLERPGGAGTVLRFVALRALPLLVFLPVALAGVLLWCLPYGVVRLTAARLRPSDDLEATYKLLAGAVYYLLWWIGLLSGAIAAGLGPLVIAAAVAAPLAGLAAITYLERARRAVEDARLHLRARARPGERDRLYALELELGRAIEDAAKSIQDRGRAGSSV